ncbi:MAG: hypothetical protein QME12_04740 [Nanoarchaeota archaeon]|nr:hypothetical protein [Nanoarchaeota archaeon]
MTDLIACLSLGKGTWADVAKLMEAESWENIYLIGTKFGKEKFTHSKKFTFIEIDPDGEIEAIKKAVSESLKGKIGIDTAINLTSGSGKEHMAVISAALTLGAGIRLISLKNNNVIEV